jgi:hypothetical protein
VRTEFVIAELSVVVFVDCLECCNGVFDFLGGQLMITVRIQGCFQRMRWWTEAVGTTLASRSAPTGRRLCDCGVNRYATDKEYRKCEGDAFHGCLFL